MVKFDEDYETGEKNLKKILFKAQIDGKDMIFSNFPPFVEQTFKNHIF